MVKRFPAWVWLCWMLVATGWALASEPISFVKQARSLEIKAGEQAIATYGFADADVPRPYFANVKASFGIQLTRNHPPQTSDKQDHPHHTGLFFSFGDVNGIDYWHMKGTCKHDSFLQEPRLADDGALIFQVRNVYQSEDGSPLMWEDVSHRIVSTKNGHRNEFDIILKAEQDVKIGSKEEGGLAMRVASGLAVDAKQGGRMEDSEGRVNGDEIWGQQADWVLYKGFIDGYDSGILLMAHPENPHRPWWHARDYGLVASHPFGPLNDKSAGKHLKAGESVRLRYAVQVYAKRTRDLFLPQGAFQDYSQAK